MIKGGDFPAFFACFMAKKNRRTSRRFSCNQQQTYLCCCMKRLSAVSAVPSQASWLLR